jgi:hypothetical protein
LVETIVHDESDQRGFRYTEALNARVAKQSAFVATVLSNLSQNCRSREKVTWKHGLDLPFSGFSNEGAGDFAYEGTISVKDRRAVLDFVLQPDSKRKVVRRVHAELTELGEPIITVK